MKGDYLLTTVDTVFFLHLSPLPSPVLSVCLSSDTELLHVNEDNVWSPQLLGECLGHAGTVQVGQIDDLYHEQLFTIFRKLFFLSEK